MPPEPKAKLTDGGLKVKAGPKFVNSKIGNGQTSPNKAKVLKRT